MKTINIAVENIKCGGCMNSIKKSLMAITGISAVDIDQEKGIVSVVGNEAMNSSNVIQKLKSLGYPQRGSSTGFDAILTEAKSFVSCAIGRMSQEK